MSLVSYSQQPVCSAQEKNERRSLTPSKGGESLCQAMKKAYIGFVQFTQTVDFFFASSNNQASCFSLFVGSVPNELPPATALSSMDTYMFDIHII